MDRSFAFGRHHQKQSTSGPDDVYTKCKAFRMAEYTPRSVLKHVAGWTLGPTLGKGGFGEQS